MADPVQSLTFLAWVREQVAEQATAQSQGRASGTVIVTLTALGANGTTTGVQSRPLPFLLAGTADVIGLHPGAVVRRYPVPGTVDHESDRCPYVELADASLPWRYTPAPAPGASSPALHPWLVLVVGEESELSVADGIATLATSVQTGVQAVGTPSSAYRFAHVQVDGAGHRTARVLCARPLDAGTDYIAALVPAFNADGAPSWTGTAPVNVPAYDSWRFHTAVPAGSFEDLAARLRSGDAAQDTGHAPMHYPRMADAPPLEVLGALVAVPASGPVTEAPLPQAVADDLAALQLPAHDELGRPVVALPRYGEAWDVRAPEDTAWGQAIGTDPRHRGVAGLGIEVGIRNQEDLVADVVAHIGALREARQRVRHLVMGVTATRSLWSRRMPAAAADRLWLLGPGMARLSTDQGTVGDLATADGRSLAPGTFSAAARRILRSGPARTALTAAAVAPPPAEVLTSANRLPPPPPSRSDGVPFTTATETQFDQARRQVLTVGRVATASLVNAANALVTRTDTRVQAAATQLVAAMRTTAQQGKPVPWAKVLPLLASADATVLAGGKDPAGSASDIGTRLGGLREGMSGQADDADLTELVAQLGASQADDPATSAVDLDALAAGVVAAFDPTVALPPAAVRVLSTVEGLDSEQPLAPPETCVGLERAVWSDVAAAFDEWLLPGVGQLPVNSVVALQTNPIFIEPFLVGLNSQLLTELRWRNIPIATGCTPIRRFWDRADTSAGGRVDDIVGIASWPADSGLGDAAHLAAGAGTRELVVALRGDLFLRYPTTLVYLQSALSAGAADFDADPDPAAPRVFPAFQGRMAADVVFFGFPTVAVNDLATYWLVLEEPPSGFRFANDLATTAAAGHDWAAAALAEPVRVLIQGDSLIAGGTQ